MVALIGYTEACRTLQDVGISSAIAHGGETRHPHCPERMVRVIGVLWLPIEIAAVLVVVSDQRWRFGLRGAAGGALVLRDIEGTGHVARRTLTFGHSHNRNLTAGGHGAIVIV